MQLTLAFLAPTTPTPSPPNTELHDPKARADAVKVLARLIAKAGQPTDQKEATDE